MLSTRIRLIFFALISSSIIALSPKDGQGIAITLGTANDLDALMQKFAHVIAVHGDCDGLRCIKAHVSDSNAQNVSFVQKKIVQVRGCCRGGETTFKQLIYENIYVKAELKKQKIAFIDCDLNGGEEEILEDILYFAYYNKCAVRVRFNCAQWKSKTTDDVAYLFIVDPIVKTNF